MVLSYFLFKERRKKNEQRKCNKSIETGEDGTIQS